MNRNPKKEKISSYSDSGFTLEKAVLSVLEEIGEAPLSEICERINRTSERDKDVIRKVLSKLVDKNVVVRSGKGVYRINRKTSLDSDGVQIPLPFYSVSALLREIPGISAPLYLRDKIVKSFNLWSVNTTSLSGYYLGGAAGDESIRPIRERLRGLNPSSIIYVTSRIRMAGVLPFELKEDRRKYGDPKFIPKNIEDESVEFIMKKLKPTFYEDTLKRLITKPELSIELAEKVAGKMREYFNEEFKLLMVEQTLAEAKSFYGLADFVLSFIDGSPITGHLDPFIRPGSEFIEEIGPELGKEILDWKRKLLEKSCSIVKNVYYSDGVYLVSILKHSRDKTIQFTVNESLVSVPDQEILKGIMRDGEVLGPFEKHRFIEEWRTQADEFNIDMKTLPVYSAYIKRKDTTLPTAVDIIAPMNATDDDIKKLLEIIYQLIVIDYSHTSIDGYYVTTTEPILTIDRYVSKHAEGIAKSVEIQLNEIIDKIMDELLNLARRYPTFDLGFFLYSVRGGLRLWQRK